MTLPIYLLNLDRRPDRADYMDAQLRALGLSYVRVSALDGKNVPDEAFLERVKPGEKTVPMARGSQAIAVTTFRIFQTLTESNADFGLILQDDIELSPDLPKLLDDLSWIPDTVDLLQLEHLGRDPTTRLVGPVMPCPLPGRRFHAMRDRHLGAGCFLIRARFVAKLLAEDPKLDMPIDQYLFNPERSALPARANAHVLVPALARQRRDLHESDLMAERNKLHEADRNLSRGQHYRRELHRLGLHARGLLRGDRLKRVGYAQTTLER